MKKLFFFLFLTTAIWSCNSTVEPESTIDPSIPTNVVSAVKTAYPDAKELKITALDANKVWDAEFLVELQKMSAIIDNQGQISETYKVARVGATLPENAKKYIDTKYPGATIKTISELIEKNVVVGYKVLIVTKEGKEVVLMFDTTGALVAGSTGDTPKAGSETKTYSIGHGDLPEIIKAVLKDKHGDYKYVKGIVTVVNGVKTYNVVVSTATTLYEYTFDQNGNLLKSSSSGIVTPTEKAIDASGIPAKAKEFMDREYKTWTFQKGVVKMKGNDIVGYMIAIMFNNKLIYLNFDATGTFVRADAGTTPAEGQKYTTIDPSTLPSAILKALESKFVSNYKILTAQSTVVENTTKYAVTVIKENTTYYFEFDATGKILTSKSYTTPATGTTQEKTITEAPATIKAFLDKNYAGWKFVKGVAIAENGKITKYTIVIKMTDGTLYYLVFNGEQAFLEARKG